MPEAPEEVNRLLSLERDAPPVTFRPTWALNADARSANPPSRSRSASNTFPCSPAPRGRPGGDPRSSQVSRAGEVAQLTQVEWHSSVSSSLARIPTMITRVVDHVIDPAKTAHRSVRIRRMALVEQHGGTHHGYFLPS